MGNIGQGSSGPRLYTVDETAERLRLSVSHTYKLIETGRMPCVRLGRAVRVSEEQLAQYVRQMEDAARLRPARLRR